MNSKKLLALAAASIFSGIALAQPTLTSAINPVAGDSWTYHYGTTTGSVPGSSGTGQSWNFSSFSETSSAPAAYMNCASAPGCGSFPGTTLVLHQGTGNSYAYYKANSTVYALAGYGGAGGVSADIIYSNQEDQTRFPLTYADEYTDDWAATLTNGGITYNRSGTTFVKADGYGTITTPAGTFNNVLRVYRNQVYQDVYSVGGSTQTINYDADLYAWYAADRREVIYG